MLFYKVEVELLHSGEEPDRSERSEQAQSIQAKTESFFMEREKTCHIIVSRIEHKKKRATLCAAVRDGVLSNEFVKDYLKAVELEAKNIKAQEVTLDFYSNLLQTADRNNFADDDDDIFEELGLSELNGRSHRYGRSVSFSETIFPAAARKKDLLQKSKGLLCDNSLHAEIERIYQGAQDKAFAGHPVHYMIQSDEMKTRNQMLQVLLTTLYQNGRLQSRRYAEVSFCGNCSLPKSGLNLLYEACAGGTVVVSYAEEDEEDTEHARVGADVIIGLCDAMRQHRNKVLTVFCVRRSSEKVKAAFMENLGAVTIVPITQETVFNVRAKGYLRHLAKEQKIAPDKELYKTISPDTGYTAADLSLLFDEWYDRQLKSKVYAQYAQLETANRQVAERKPKGSAIDELEQMIGLTEAKKIIHHALDFYKAQKLFKEKGISTDRPAMHMVFTGNPGTAKTSVARLFAQIMKDNELLSIGDLFEVGRGDLVGKYVGWTAQIVKQKFKAAKGSVLFIDEAYSLVDDRDGLFGDEAINTIVQEMENRRDDMIVIFAGYPDKMEKFLEKNPGLRSRIAFHVPFDDYNADELYEITELMATKKNVSLSEDVREKLLPIYERGMKRDDFGNGRYARNLLEKAAMKQASRLVAMDVDDVTKADITTLLAEDFEAPAENGKDETRRIGF